MNRPIIKIGLEHHYPDITGLLFFGFFSAETEKRATLPVAKCEAFFFDVLRNRSTILPWYATNIDAEVKFHADGIRLQNVYHENELSLYPETIYSVNIGGSCQEIWRMYVSGKHIEAISRAIDEFHGYFPEIEKIVEL